MGIVNYSRHGEIVEIIVRDFTGAKLEVHSCPVHDKKRYKKILDYLRDKYDFAPEIDLDQSVNAPSKKDLDWWA